MEGPADQTMAEFHAICLVQFAPQPAAFHPRQPHTLPIANMAGSCACSYPAPRLLTVQHVEEAVGGVVAGIQHALHRVAAGDDDLRSCSGRGSGMALSAFAHQPSIDAGVCW